jgi:hypothetical protein
MEVCRFVETFSENSYEKHNQISNRDISHFVLNPM